MVCSVKRQRAVTKKYAPVPYLERDPVPSDSKLTALIGIEKVENDIPSNTVILYVLITT